MTDFLKIANKKFKSRLIVGTGKYKSFLECSKAIKAAGADMVTVAVRRVNILDKKGPERDKYYQEPEVMKFFRDNDNKIKSRSEGPGGLSDFKYYSNPYVISKKGDSSRGWYQ